MKPLSCVRILVGRARHQSNEFAGSLRELGATVLQIPFIEIRKPRSYKPLDDAIQNLADYHWLILTSVNGVEAFWNRLEKLKIKKSALQTLKIAAIGPATRNAIEEHGAKVFVVPTQYVAEAVVKSLRNKVSGKRVLLARAKVARDVIPRELRKLGATVDVVEAYETVVPKASQVSLRSLLRDPVRCPDIVTFTSSSTVHNFVNLVGKRAIRTARDTSIRFASIGPITSASLRKFGLPVDIEASEYTISGLIDAICRFTK